jgi:hypothetical protein
VPFFEPIGHAPEPEPEFRPRPPWAGPPSGWLPGIAPSHHIVFQTDDTTLGVGPCEAYPTGVLLRVHVRFRHPMKVPDHGWFRHRGETTIRFGFEFSDGFRWTGAEATRPPSSGGQRHVNWDSGDSEPMGECQHLWLWPLPPQGPIRFVGAWPAHGIPETEVTVDAREILAAATRAIELWPGG